MAKNLRESNLKVIKKALTNSTDYVDLKESMSRQFGVDITDEKQFNVNSPDFSWNKVQRKLKEADASGSFSQFLRAGVQNITNSMYETTETTFEDFTTVVASTKDTELYAPNHGVSFPKQVGPQEKYPEVASAALDIQLKNYKFGSMYSLTKELLDDDQTGSFQRQAGLLGQYMKLLTEVLVYGKLASVSGMQYQQYSIPVSETKPSYETNYPWTLAAAPFKGGGFNAATPGALLQSNIQNGIQALMAQKNLQGILMNVSPNRLIISPKYNFDSAVLANSAYYPSGAAATGAVGGAFSINPLKGMFDITVGRYMFDNLGVADGSSKAWYLVDDSKPWFIVQMREPVAVEQEATNAGSSFEIDVYRFKARTRMNADFLDPRFAWRGSDGSI
jgi:hypothetical protein